MQPIRSRWGLGAKLAMVGMPFLMLALLSIVATLWMSRQLDGGAAAVNEAGRMRMQAYRIAFIVGEGNSPALSQLSREFDGSLALLRNGDPQRPLFVPWDDDLTADFLNVENAWRQFQLQWTGAYASARPDVRAQTVGFVADIDRFVARIESHMSRWTAVLHILEMCILALAVVGATTILFTAYRFVLEPVGALSQAIRRMQDGDLGARVDKVTSDEFGTLAQGFNGMAEHLQRMYRDLESKVLEKTAELEEEKERLEALYGVTALVAGATSLVALAQDFSQRIMRIARADGVALRWLDPAHQRYAMLAASGLPITLVLPIHSMDHVEPSHFSTVGFAGVVNVPIRLHDRLMGEVSLFFHAHVSPSDAERSLLEALSSHLASAMENLRLKALEKEAAVSEERHLIARELHDSIAQSLAFLKIQVQLMRDAMHAGSSQRIQEVLEEIDAGVRESYADVRELLVHFRTRTNTENIEHALATTLRKFEHQTGLKATLGMTGHGIPLAPDVQIQVLHILQEALSNVRKHAQATAVWLDVQQHPVWRFEVRDDGVGFASAHHAVDETHIGLRIMKERAQLIGASLDVLSQPQKGCVVQLTLKVPAIGQALQAAMVAT